MTEETKSDATGDGTPGGASNFTSGDGADGRSDDKTTPTPGDAGGTSDKGADGPGSEKTGDASVPSYRLRQEREKREAVEKEFSEAVDAEVEVLPETLRALVPEGTPKQRLDWIRKAREAGVVGAKPVPRTDDQPPPQDQPVRETGRMQGMSLISQGLAKRS
ncbi:MAG: hypothetical protein RID91_16075 [Azospirillaceae bacterium]